MVVVFRGGGGNGDCEGEVEGADQAHPGGPAEYLSLRTTHVVCPLALRCGGTGTDTGSAWGVPGECLEVWELPR